MNPTPVTQKLSEEQLDARAQALDERFLELKRYEQALKAWDVNLHQQEEHLNRMENDLLALDESDEECDSDTARCISTRLQGGRLTYADVVSDKNAPVDSGDSDNWLKCLYALPDCR